MTLKTARTEQQIPERLRVGMISLGCAKNLVDAEIMLGSLMQQGVEITNDPREADAVIVNTCSFIDAAQEESVDTILESVEVREASQRGQALIVSGCLPQRFREELPKLLPEVDAFMGIDQVADVPKIVEEALARRAARLETAGPARRKGRSKEVVRQLEQKVVPASGPVMHVTQRPRFIPDFSTPRFRLTPGHFAYVKIAEGCNHPCSFCIIPRMRGSHRSRAQEDVVEEARELVAQGVKELNLISQDSTYYGMDLRPKRSGSIAAPQKFQEAARELPAGSANLCSLLRALNEVEGDFWIRLLYTHPAHWTDELIETIASCDKVARYVDMPLQHIHDVMLERMRRETSGEYIERLIERMRAGIPGIAVRTTFIVGFPGETDAYFERLLRFIRETRFERLGIFAYSQEEGTLAGRMGTQVPDEVKAERKKAAMEAQLAIARELGASSREKELKVLAEGQASVADLKRAKISSWEHGLIRSGNGAMGGMKGRYTVCRGEWDAPDIDGRVYVRENVPAGQFCKVRVVGHTDYDLIAEQVKAGAVG